MEVNNPNQPVNLNETSVHHVSNPVNNQRGNFPIILGVLILLLIVGGGAYYLGTRNNKTIIRQDSNIQPTINPQNTVVNSSGIPVVTQTPSDTETANWKTYINEKVKFSLKYPSTWTEKGPVANNDSTLVYLHAGESFGEGPEPIQYYVWISSDDKLPNVKLAKESGGSYTAYKTDELPSRSGALSAFITKDEKTYVAISITPYDVKQPYPSQRKYIDIFNQILSTFKFTN